MINCRNCNFEVGPTMRHSLIKNFCPACGGALLGELHSRRLALFKQKLSNQPFSEKLMGDDIFDIALFMLVEFFPPDTGDKADGAAAGTDSAAQEDEGEAAEAEATADPAASEESLEETYEAIRDQVRTEILTKNEDLPEDLDADLKVQRLKRIAKESKVRSPGAFVRRVTND